MIINVIFVRRPRYLANKSFQDTNAKRDHLDTDEWWECASKLMLNTEFCFKGKNNMPITYTKHWEPRNGSLDKSQVTVTRFPAFSIIVSRRHSNVSTISPLLKRLDDVLCVSGNNPSSPRGADICCQICLLNLRTFWARFSMVLEKLPAEDV